MEKHPSCETMDLYHKLIAEGKKLIEALVQQFKHQLEV